ncbi:MAG TPA: hypothetical protein EYG82_04915 [Sulfurovum sp.]|nr:hypothetical protein [Sulfurovum sp.]
MQTIQLKVNDGSLNVVMTLLDNLKKDMIQEIKIIKKSNTLTSDTEKKLEQVKGILKNRIANPMEYQRTLRDEWDRE